MNRLDIHGILRMFRRIGRKMSTSEEIREVFEQEIAEKTRLVVSKFGPEVLYSGLHGFQIEKHPCSDIICRDKLKAKRKKRCL